MFNDISIAIYLPIYQPTNPHTHWLWLNVEAMRLNNYDD